MHVSIQLLAAIQINQLIVVDRAPFPSYGRLLVTLLLSTWEWSLRIST